MGRMIYLKDVVTLELDEGKCVGCGMCLIVCPHLVMGMNNGRARIETRDACMECGACARNCPTDAITLQAGVGCAAAVINAALSGNSSACCGPTEGAECCGTSAHTPESSKKTSCC